MRLMVPVHMQTCSKHSSECTSVHAMWNEIACLQGSLNIAGIVNWELNVPYASYFENNVEIYRVAQKECNTYNH